VQTFEQVQAAKKFIESNFDIVEKEDKGLLLNEDEFGYRDMHYIVRLKPKNLYKIPAGDHRKIGERRAEIQVRTWVQHAWADTLHDRLYKTKLNFSPEIRRTGALLAAIMEDGDRTFSRLAFEIDGMLANYSAYAKREDVEKEIAIVSLILKNETEKAKKEALSLQMAKLVSATGDYFRAVKILKPYKSTKSHLKSEILLHLGYAICKEHRGGPYGQKSAYSNGQELLKKVIEICQCSDVCEVPNLRKLQNLNARAHSYLAWSYEVPEKNKHRARECYQTALLYEPLNPYYLSNVLGYEIYCSSKEDLARSMRANIQEAIKTCNEHALSGTEMPYACFTAGRLNLLLGSCVDPGKNGEERQEERKYGYSALSWYARGVYHYLAGTHVVPRDVLKTEIEWMQRVNSSHSLPKEYSWSRDLLSIVGTINRQFAGTEHELDLKGLKKLDVVSPVLIIAGGAASISAETIKRVRSLLSAPLENFSGTVISGGTKCGVPGLVGDIADEYQRLEKLRFKLFGYATKKFHADALPHPAYQNECFGSDFSPDHVMQSWKDILAAGIEPRDVSVLGFGGGLLSAAEYRIALALGAKVGVVKGTGNAVDALLSDPLWSTLPNLLPLPEDRSTLRAFAIPAGNDLKESDIKIMAKNFHKEYIDNSQHRLPPNMRPWKDLLKTFKRANKKQAKYAIEIIRSAGFDVRKSNGIPTKFKFNEDDVEKMAEMEHGRWNIERLCDGWRYGRIRDDTRRVHDCLVSWRDLPEDVRDYDRKSVRAFPGILAKAGLEISRPKRRAAKSAKL
jgi:tetratricopeptide (TPR) repeat protein